MFNIENHIYILNLKFAFAFSIVSHTWSICSTYAPIITDTQTHTHTCIVLHSKTYNRQKFVAQFRCYSISFLSNFYVRFEWIYKNWQCHTYTMVIVITDNYPYFQLLCNFQFWFHFWFLFFCLGSNLHQFKFWLKTWDWHLSCVSTNLLYKYMQMHKIKPTQIN